MQGAQGGRLPDRLVNSSGDDHDRSRSRRRRLYRADHARNNRQDHRRSLRRPRGFALLPTMGGQTHSTPHCRSARWARWAVDADDRRHRARHRQGRDRELFREAMIGSASKRALPANQDADQALEALEDIGLPIIIAVFTLAAPAAESPTTRRSSSTRRTRHRRLADQRGADRGIGVGLERVRDGGGARKRDNCIILCSIENLGPMGVPPAIDHDRAGTHATDRIPDLRDARSPVRADGVETGGSNVQFAVNPADGRLRSSR